MARDDADLTGVPRAQIYAPGAGHLPTDNQLPGREHLIRAWQAMCADVQARGRVAARDTVFVGNRGVGKTVVMKACAAHAERVGYLLLPMQGSPSTTLSAAILATAEAQAAARGGSYWGGVVAALRRITGAGVSAAGFGGSISLADPAGRDSEPARGDPYNVTAIADAVAGLAREVRADAGRGGVLVCVDELQMIDGADMRTLGGVLNHLNNWHAEAPVIFAATGLPTTMQSMIGPDPEHPLISNPARLFITHQLTQHLDDDQIAAALRGPALQVGADWTREAIGVVARVTHGYPAHLQALAAAAWERSEQLPVDAPAVELAVPAAQRGIDQMYMQPRWATFSAQQRAYVILRAAEGLRHRVVDGGRGGEDRAGRGHAGHHDTQPVPGAGPVAAHGGHHQPAGRVGQPVPADDGRVRAVPVPPDQP
jgi:hypothetical protein